MANTAVKVGVEVRVLAGGNSKKNPLKGKVGKVIRVDREAGKVWIEGVNVGKKTVKPSQTNPQGGFDNVERPVHVSNVMPTERWNARQARKGAKADGGAN